ncbi:MAG: hypothetical protein Q8941_16695 [Bacteroidota bacterium]|nr:hypothetical protein [Bacteroidota bacterium]
MHKAAREYGFDLNIPITAEEETKYKEREDYLHTTVKQPALSKLCKPYQRIVRPFAEKNESSHRIINEPAGCACFIKTGHY